MVGGTIRRHHGCPPNPQIYTTSVTGLIIVGKRDEPISAHSPQELSMDAFTDTICLHRTGTVHVARMKLQDRGAGDHDTRLVEVMSSSRIDLVGQVSPGCHVGALFFLVAETSYTKPVMAHACRSPWATIRSVWVVYRQRGPTERSAQHQAPEIVVH